MPVPTFGELIDETIGYLLGFIAVPQQGTLSSSIVASDTQLSIDFGDQPGAARPNGLIEVDRELMVVTRYDASTGVASVAPWGRGQRGTTAVSHASGARVTVRPPFPRKQVGDTINEVLRSSCPPLGAVKDLAPIETGTLIGLGYNLPSDFMRVLRVDETDTGLPEFIAERRSYQRWAVRSVAGQKLLEVDKAQVLQTIQLTYLAQPGTLVNETDDFVVVSGMTENVRDLVVFGAVSRLVMGSELARQQVSSIEAAIRSDKIPAGSGTSTSRYFQALYTQRLLAEQDRLNEIYPIQIQWRR